MTPAMTRIQAIATQMKIEKGIATYSDPETSIREKMEVLAELGEYMARYGVPLIEVLEKYAEERKAVEDAILNQSVGGAE